MLRLLLCLLIFPIKAFSCTEPGEGFLPLNNRKYPVNFKRAGLTLEKYHEAIDRVMKIYEPIIRSNDAQLVVERKWESQTVNAGTFRRDEGKTWVINLYGGYARHPDITQDGYMLVICHEIGHHIGGAPKKFYQESGIHWASTEGQADYFATLKCLRRVFEIDNNEEIIAAMDIPESIRTECARSFKSPAKFNVCLRTSMAGISVSKVNADVRKVPDPDIEITDSASVESTRNEHPVPQCRLNTYFQGALCPVSYRIPVSQFDESDGTCHPVFNFTTGLRPSCWYKAK